MIAKIHCGSGLVIGTGGSNKFKALVYCHVAIFAVDNTSGVFRDDSAFICMCIQSVVVVNAEFKFIFGGIVLPQSEREKHPRQFKHILIIWPFKLRGFGVLGVICVSIQYLQYPEAILSEIHRILKPGGITIISFSNRMFYQKAISAWREAIETDRIELVKSYINSVKINNLPGFNSPKVIASQSKTPLFMQMLGMGGSDPFYALIASRKS